MKNKIICLVLCIVSLAVSMVLLVDTIDKEAPVINRGEPKKEEKLPDAPPVSSGLEAVELTDVGISAFASRIEDFVERLAYGEDKSFEYERNYIIENARSVAEWFEQANNKSGAEYMTCVADSFESSRTDFVSDDAFGSNTSRILKKLDSAKKKIENADNPSLYPEFDTEVGGSLTLALLSIYNAQINGAISDTDTFTVTLGGAALLGDRLGDSDDTGFKKAYDSAERAFPFYKLSSILKNDDASFITFLSCLTESSDSAVLDPVKGLPAYAESLMGIDCVSLSPSEIMDYGETGFDDTVSALSNNGISYSVNNGTSFLDTEFGKIVYITCDLTDEEVSIAGKDRSVAKIKQMVEVERENGAELVIVMLHWNTRKRESTAFSADYLGTVISPYEAHFDAFNKDIARGAITAGADLVVGTGAHVLQGIELYKDKFIVYNPGNLSYPLNLDSEEANTAYSFLFSQTFVKEGEKVKTLSWRVIPVVNTETSEPYAPTPVFDEEADKIIDILEYQSSYFAKSITDFNYIEIKK